MKQNSQWLSQVRTRSKTAEDTSAPRGCPAPWPPGRRTGRPTPRRRTTRSSSGSSTSRLYSMTSRGDRPLRRRSSSPGRRPDRSAGDDSVTATTLGAVVTRGADIVPGYPASGLPAPTGRAGGRSGAAGAPVAWAGARRPSAAGRAAGVLRRGGEGDQGAGLDGPGLRAAGLLLPRDRPQPSRGGPVPGPGGGLRGRCRRGARRRPAHAVGPRLGPRGGRPRPGPRAGWWSTRSARW